MKACVKGDQGSLRALVSGRDPTYLRGKRFEDKRPGLFWPKLRVCLRFYIKHGGKHCCAGFARDGVVSGSQGANRDEPFFRKRGWRR